VRANVVTPGIVQTPLTAQIKDHPEWYAAYTDKGILGRWARLHELAGVVVFLASEVSSYVTGSFVLLDGGRRTIRPGLCACLMVR
jgi:NAD(P)-dependent dehydrogenase (short-subunit alcohol dehydrogenase family)